MKKPAAKPPRATRVSETAVATEYYAPSREGKVRKEFWLDPAVLDAARAELGVATEREAVEIALDMIVVRRQVMGALASLRSRGGLVDVER